MKTVRRTLYFESLWEQGRYGRYKPVPKVAVDGFPPVTIGAGRDDDVDTFVEGVLLIVLARNDRYDYIGAEIFDATGERVAEFFAIGDNDESAGYLLGLKPINAARRIANWADIS